jgi:hypothetical protein
VILTKLLNSQNDNQGKSLMETVVASINVNSEPQYGNLVVFLQPEVDNPRKPVYEPRDNLLIAMNSQYKEITGKSLFELYLDVSVQETVKDVGNRITFKLFNILHSLLEEIQEFKDVENEISIGMFLKMAKDLKAIDPKDYTTAEKYLLSTKIYYVDDILMNVLNYYDTTDVNYKRFKFQLVTINTPIYKMLFDIIDGKEKEFIEEFPKNLLEIEKSSLTRYHKDENNPHDVADFIFTILMAAIKHNRKLIIDRIFEQENFTRVKLDFPPNMKNSEMGQYVTAKLLQNDHELGLNKIPKSWLTPETFESFLDSQINYKNEDLIEIDTSFMIHRTTKKKQVKTPEDANNMLMFWESTLSMRFIQENKSLRNLVTHPVISTYIDLKTYKHKRVLYYGFGLFLLLVVLPFAVYIANKFNNWHDSLNLLLLIPINTLIAREMFQFKFIEKKWQKYSSNMSNQAELLLIMSLIGVLVHHLSAISVLSVSLFTLKLIFYATKLYEREEFSFIDLCGYLLLLVLPFVGFTVTSLLNDDKNIIIGVQIVFLSIMFLYLCVKVQKTCFRFKDVTIETHSLMALLVIAALDCLGFLSFPDYFYIVNQNNCPMVLVLFAYPFIAWKNQRIVPIACVSTCLFLFIWTGILWVLLIPTIYLLMLLWFQFSKVQSWRKFIGNFQNYFEFFVVFCLIAIVIQNSLKLNPINCFRILSTFFMTGSFLLTLPFGSIQIYMRMLKDVTITFLKFFFVLCASILIAYAVSFMLVFNQIPGQSFDNATDPTQAFEETSTSKPEDNIKNFGSFDSALAKLVLMLSGEFTIEPTTLESSNLIFFCIFVLVTFILFNLIIGLAIDDVQKLQLEARKLFLIENAKKFVKAQDYYYWIYEEYGLSVLEDSELNFDRRWKVRVFKFFLSAYPFVHKLDKFYVNIETQKIITMIDGKEIEIIDDKINHETFEEIKRILKERKEKSEKKECCCPHCPQCK